MNNMIVNIFVIGFHHKRGCEVEFVYPPSNDIDSSLIIPDIWKNLTSLALPDGAHKNNSDIINFILPGDEKSNNKVLFGVSCFKQISSENIKNKSDDITRNSIQKSVVVLSTQPFYNAISSLLQGITENYFEIHDFNQRDILIESFHQLNEHFRLIMEDNSVKQHSDTGNLVDQGFSLSDLISRYEHNVFGLIKLIILRKKILIFMEPISKLTTTILCLVSLFTGEFTSLKFQDIMDKIDGNSENNSFEYENSLEEEEILQNAEINFSPNDTDKQSNNENKSLPGTSLFQNIKSGGGQAIKVFSSFAVSSLIRSPDSDINTKQSQIDDLSAPLPPFIDKVGYVRDNDKLNCNDLRDSWGFPLGIFDKKNVLLPYASLGYLNVLENKKIDSFVIGANNHLWRMKQSKIDVIINEDNKNGGIEYCQKEQANAIKNTDDPSLMKLTQLTVLDRRLADYLLGVVKSHNNPIVKSNSQSNFMQVSYSKNEDSNQDLSIEITEETLNIKAQETYPIHQFPDQKSLDEWIRQVFIDYIRALLLSAAGWGTRHSFEDFGWDFMLAVQQQDYFKDWYYSIDKEKVLQASNYSLNSLVTSASSLSLNISNSTMKNNFESENNKKSNGIMNYDHPGRFIPGKLGDNLPGYYQMREYADQSKALVNRSVNEIRRIGTERGGQLKSSMSAGFSKLSGIAKVHGSKFGSSWWASDAKNVETVTNENKKVIE